MSFVLAVSVLVIWGWCWRSPVGDSKTSQEIASGESASVVRPVLSDDLVVSTIVASWRGSQPWDLHKIFIATRTGEPRVAGPVEEGFVFSVHEDVAGKEPIGAEVFMTAKDPPRGRALYFARGGAISKSIVQWWVEVSVSLDGVDPHRERQLVERLRANVDVNSW